MAGITSVQGFGRFSPNAPNVIENFTLSPAVTIGKAVPFGCMMSQGGGLAGLNANASTALITSTTNLQFQRTTGNSNNNALGWVADFGAGVRVQTVSFTPLSAGVPQTVNLPADWDITKSFVLPSWRDASTTFDTEYPAVWLAPGSPPTVNAQLSGTGAIDNVVVHVIEMDNITVQRGIFPNIGTALSTSAAVTVPPTNRGFPLLTWRTDSTSTNAMNRRMFRGYFSGGTVVAQRGISGFNETTEIRYEVVTFTDETLCQLIPVTIGIGAFSATNVPIAAVDTAKSVFFPTGFGLYGEGSSGTNDEDQRYKGHGFFQSSTTFQLNRGVGTGSATYEIVVIDFSTMGDLAGAASALLMGL